MHRAQLWMQLLLYPGLDGIGHHQIGFAVDDLLEDGDVVRMHDDLRLLEAGSGKHFIRSARVDDNPYI
ncbi:hypothetical protein D3C80_2107370 [compost metagenome]